MMLSQSTMAFVLSNLALLTLLSYVTSQECVTVSKGNLKIRGNPLVGQKCQFPFFHRKKWYDGCKEFRKYPGKYMCATKVDKNGTMVKGNFGVCGEGCRVNGDIIEGDTACQSPRTCMSRYQCPLFQKLISIRNKESQEYQSLLSELKGGICNKVGQMKNKRICCQLPREHENGFPTSCADVPKEGQHFSGASLPQPGQCGIKCKTPANVIGGEKAQLGEFPWAALLGYTIRKRVWDIEVQDYRFAKTIGWKCGGSLINSWYVLTAGHCVTGILLKQLEKVKLGELVVGQDPDCTEDGTQCYPSVQIIDVEKVIIHDDYERVRSGKGKGIFFDIALIRMKKEAILNIAVQFACLPVDMSEWAVKFGARNLEEGLVGRDSTVIGWGQIRSYDQGNYSSIGVITNHLQKLEVPVVSNEECIRKMQGFTISENNICAGGQIGQDSCRGDSGGGLAIKHRDQDTNYVYVQIGLVSYGSSGICGNGKPGVYTRITHYIQWIKDNLEN